jgi:hypothetical protein
MVIDLANVAIWTISGIASDERGYALLATELARKQQFASEGWSER